MKHLLLIIFLLLFSLAASSTQPTQQTLTFPASPPDHFTLQGTLLLPPSATPTHPVPALLLLPGSGPTDRDGNQPPYFTPNLLLDLATHLASQGFATFRFDKRACPRYALDWPKTTAAQNTFFSADRFTSDAAAAYELLRHHPSIDPTRLAILGHSEGGLIALQLAPSLKPSALILLSTCARDLGPVLLDQLSTNLQHNQADPLTTRAYLTAAANAIDQIRKDSTLPKNLPPDLASLFPPNCTSLLHTYFTLNPLTLASTYNGPVLLLQGSADSQVSPAKDFQPLVQTFSHRSPPSVTDYLLIPHASHNFKLTPPPSITGPTSPVLLQKISTWLTSTLKP